MRGIFAVFMVCCFTFNCNSQNYTSYFTGSSTDFVTNPQGGVCLMGGASEHDEAMRWFLNRADGGDVLVLRASGSDGYNDYFYTDLGIPVNSVETIVFNNAAASNEVYIQDKISNAEAIWFAGGDQWDYISYWRNTKVDSLINDALENRNIVIGGTSAGMAILGKFYFSAQNGTVTSAQMLANPYNSDATIDSSSFLKVNYLEKVITDTHYDNPDRKGRHIAFMAKMTTDFGEFESRGIACDEYTAVCIDENGNARVFGEYPAYDENAYFIQANCEVNDIIGENCSPGNPLTWDKAQAAFKVYQIKGTDAGTHTFNLTTWESGTGGEWQNWYVNNGVLFENPSNAPICATELAENENSISIYPNPVNEVLTIEGSLTNLQIVAIYSLTGTILSRAKIHGNTVNVSHLNPGIYFLNINKKGSRMIKFIKN